MNICPGLDLVRGLGRLIYYEKLSDQKFLDRGNCFQVVIETKNQGEWILVHGLMFLVAREARLCDPMLSNETRGNTRVYIFH